MVYCGLKAPKLWTHLSNRDIASLAFMKLTSSIAAMAKCALDHKPIKIGKNYAKA